MKHEARSTKPRIAFVVSAPETAKAFLMPHFRAIQGDFNIDLYANATSQQDLTFSFAPAHLHSVNIERKPSPIKDLKAAVTLYRAFKNNNYAIVQSVTPKAGLLSMLAAKIASVPIRLHWMTGQVWATKTGFSRWYLKELDRIMSRLATHLLVDSHSQREFLIEQNIAPPKKMEVLGSGSICGVDTNRFKPDPIARKEVRESLGIREDDIILLFVGRLNRDKGIHELLEAFHMLPSSPSTHLILVGRDEEGIQHSLQQIVNSQPQNIHFMGQSDQPERYMAAADIFVMPSHREGFGLSVIEAAAAGIPAIVSDVYGLQDAVIGAETGFLFEKQNASDLLSKVDQLLSDTELRGQLGSQARNRAKAVFTCKALTDEYRSFLLTTSAKSLPTPKKISQ